MKRARCRHFTGIQHDECLAGINYNEAFDGHEPGDEAAKGRPINSPIKDYAPIWKLMANTGLRRAEALALPWANVSNVIRVESTTSSRTKSRKWRQIPLSHGATDALSRLRFVTSHSGHVLPRIRPESLTRAFDRCLKRAGLDGSLHCLRHSFCSHLAMKGLDIYTIKELAGHSSVVTTGKYMHLSPDYLQGAVEGFEL